MIYGHTKVKMIKAFFHSHCFLILRKALEMAKKLKEMGMEFPLIAKVSGLALDEIMNL